MQWFFIIVPAYNADRWIATCLTTIEGQNYDRKHFKVVVVDDCSTDKTWEIIQRFDFLKIRNDIHNGSVIENILKAIDLGKPDLEDIVMIVDGDDWLADYDVLNHLDEVYKEYVWFTYGQYEPWSGKYHNFCKPILNTKTYRKNEEWTIGQLRTWKHWLWKHVLDCDLRDKNGKYFTVAGDRPYIYPMIEMAGKHLRLINKVIYIYNDLNPINEFRCRPKEAEAMAKFIINRNEYKEL